jgi:hypothetical protein
MLSTIATWLLVAAFFGAGLFNAIGTAATQDNFARWGYPRWWCRVTGGLEMASAILVAFPASRLIGLVFGAIIIGAALITVLRGREFLHHIAPLSLFVALLVLVAVTG